mmetsp:Transcript_7597/g.10746  ORF Transcript_7597/g.10746 Transcript_7597/m.10746 type:complete len:107 (-) Transcript_7597:545-865(-)
MPSNMPYTCIGRIYRKKRDPLKMEGGVIAQRVQVMVVRGGRRHRQTRLYLVYIAYLFSLQVWYGMYISLSQLEITHLLRHRTGRDLSTPYSSTSHSFIHSSSESDS